jgi:ferritin-like metal-binding protein YciE
MKGYSEQRRIVEALKKDSTKFTSKVLLDVIDSINDAEKQGRLIREIYECAKKNREFCLHCDSIAKIIEEFQK